MPTKLKNLAIIVCLSLIPTFALWLPFFLRLTEFWNIPIPQGGMATIVSNYDGPLYLVVAKTLYNLQAIKANYQFPLPVEYYAAHFPLFPALIRAFSYALGYPYAMLAVTLISSFFALYFFHKLTGSLWLTTIFAIFPARWLIVRSVGSPEPLFVAAILAAVYFFKKEKYLLAGLAGAIAQLTKSPGILLFVAFALSLLVPQIKRLKLSFRGFPILLIPAALLSVFVLYSFVFHNFWAYFASGDNIHLFFPPFSIFNFSAPWVGTFWLEEIIFVYLFGALGLIQLVKQKESVAAWFVGIFFASTIFVSHRDLIRYSLPIVPFILIAFKDYLMKKEFKYVFLFLALPIYLFSIAYISGNIMPISNWQPFL